MKLFYRDPFPGVWGQLRQMQQEMNQMFHRWGAGDGASLWGTPAYPALNMWEDVEAVHVEAELPGFDLKDLAIYVTGGNQLTIKGERKRATPEKSHWHRQERNFGTFVRVLTLPFEVDSDKVEARLENGILTIKLAKHESAKPRKIQVKA